jgi:hypothetical protein
MHFPRATFERVERDLERAGLSLDTAEWFYFRYEPSSPLLEQREGWVLWRPATGEQLAFLPLDLG